MSGKGKGGMAEYYFAPRTVISRDWAFFLCLASFCLEMFFTNKMWIMPDRGMVRMSKLEDTQSNLKSEDCKRNHVLDYGANHTVGLLDKADSNFELELVAARAEREALSRKLNKSGQTLKRIYPMVIRINMAFSSHKRRDCVRATWTPQGEKLKKLEEEKGIVICFALGHRILDKAIEAEEKMHEDFLRLEHTEGCMELSTKTKIFFATAVSLWDAEFYVKADEDVHVNLAFVLICCGNTWNTFSCTPQQTLGLCRIHEVRSPPCRKGSEVS